MSNEDQDLPLVFDPTDMSELCALSGLEAPPGFFLFDPQTASAGQLPAYPFLQNPALSQTAYMAGPWLPPDGLGLATPPSTLVVLTNQPMDGQPGAAWPISIANLGQQQLMAWLAQTTPSVVETPQLELDRQFEAADAESGSANSSSEGKKKRRKAKSRDESSENASNFSFEDDELDDNEDEEWDAGSSPKRKRRASVPARAKSTKEGSRAHDKGQRSRSHDGHGAPDAPLDDVSVRVFANAAKAQFGKAADDLTATERKQVLRNIMNRRKRNMESARKSRDKRKEYIDTLEAQVKELEQERDDLVAKMEELRAQLKG